MSSKFLRGSFRSARILGTLLIFAALPMRSFALPGNANQEEMPLKKYDSSLITFPYQQSPIEYLIEKNNFEAIKYTVSEPAYGHFYDAYNLMNEYGSKKRRQILRHLNSAIKIEPRFYAALVLRGLIHGLMKNEAASQADLNTVISSAPGELWAYHVRSYLSLLKGDLKVAKADIEKVLDYGLINIAALQLRASINWQLADYEGVVSDLTNAINLRPKDPFLYSQRSEAFRELAKFEMAYQDLEKALELNPHNPLAKLTQALTYWKQENYKSALLIMNNLLTEYPENPEYYLWNGLIHLSFRDHPIALKDFEKAIKLKPNWPEPRFYKVLTYDSMNIQERALLEVNQFLKKYPNHARALVFRGVLTKNQHDLERAVEIEPNNPHVRYELARYYHLGLYQPDRATEQAEAILDISQKYWQGHMVRCIYFNDEMRYREAYSECREALKLNPFLPDMQELLEEIKGSMEDSGQPLPVELNSPRSVRDKNIFNNPTAFKEVAGLIRYNYVPKDRKHMAVDESHFPDVKSLLAQLDTHSSLLLEENFPDDFAGVGMMVLRIKNDFVCRPLLDSPSARAGIENGEKLIAIDDVIITPAFSLADVVSMLRGPQKSWIRLKIRKNNGNETTLRLERERIEIASVQDHFLISEGIDYIKIIEFTPETSKSVDDICKEYAGRQYKGLIIDLRGNSGGLLNQAVKTAGSFLPDNTRLGEVRGLLTAKVDTFLTYTEGKALPPLVLLVDGATSGAAEFFARALKNQNRATILGSKTAGSGISSKMFPLHAGGALRLTTGYIFDAKGEPIEGNGIIPDIYISDESCCQTIKEDSMILAARDHLLNLSRK